MFQEYFRVSSNFDLWLLRGFSDLKLQQTRYEILKYFGLGFHLLINWYIGIAEICGFSTFQNWQLFLQRFMVNQG